MSNIIRKLRIADKVDEQARRRQIYKLKMDYLIFKHKYEYGEGDVIGGLKIMDEMKVEIKRLENNLTPPTNQGGKNKRRKE